MSKIYVRNKSTTSRVGNNLSVQEEVLKNELVNIRSIEKDRANKRYKKKNKGKYQQRNKHQVTKDTRLSIRGNSLEANLPKSEVWFRERYFKEDMGHQFKEDAFKDQFNKPFNNRYIPDIHNRGYKYIIEVDGSIHDNPDIIYKDRIKDYYYYSRGFIVIRVLAYNDRSYDAGIKILKKHIAIMNTMETKRRNLR